MIELKNKLWKAIEDYTDAVAYAEAFTAVNEVFADNKSLEMKAAWETTAEERKKIVDALIDLALGPPV